MEIINSWWTYEVRLVPILLAFGIFSGIQLLRKVIRMGYSPSYFAIFPVSLVDAKVAEYLGYYGDEEDPAVEKRQKRNLLRTAWISMFLTFLLVPLTTGLIAAFILTPHEFTGFLFLLLGTEGLRCLKATYDFARYWDNWKATRPFAVFYFMYLIFLALVVRRSYHFAIPFTSQGDYQGLWSALEPEIASFLIYVLLMAVASNIIAHFLVTKDSSPVDEDT